MKMMIKTYRHACILSLFACLAVTSAERTENKIDVHERQRMLQGNDTYSPDNATIPFNLKAVPKAKSPIDEQPPKVKSPIDQPPPKVKSPIDEQPPKVKSPIDPPPPKVKTTIAPVEQSPLKSKGKDAEPIPKTPGIPPPLPLPKGINATGMPVSSKKKDSKEKSKNKQSTLSPSANKISSGNSTELSKKGKQGKDEKGKTTKAPKLPKTGKVKGQPTISPNGTSPQPTSFPESKVPSPPVSKAPTVTKLPTTTTSTPSTSAPVKGVTKAPISTATKAPISSATKAPIANGPSTVLLNGYNLLYTINQQRFLLPSEYKQTANVTQVYLNNYWTQTFKSNNQVLFRNSSTVMVDNDFSFGDPVVIVYQSTVTFQGNSPTVPSVSSLNQLLQLAFTGPNEVVYRNFLTSNVDKVNLFSTTTNVQYQVAAAAAEKKATQSTESSAGTLKYTLIGASGGLLAFVLVAYGLRRYDQQQERKNLRSEGPEKVCNEDNQTVNTTTLSNGESGAFTPINGKTTDQLGLVAVNQTIGEKHFSYFPEKSEEDDEQHRLEAETDRVEERQIWLNSRGEFL